MTRAKSSKNIAYAAGANGSVASTLHNGSTSNTSLLDTLATSPHELLFPSPDIHSAALQLAKFYLDPIAGSVNEAQIARRDEARRSFKRKRNTGEFENEDEERQMNRDRTGADVLKIKSLTVEGFETQQVWEQVNQVAKAVGEEVERLQKNIGREKRKSGLDEEGFNDVSESEIIEEDEEDDMSDLENGISHLNGESLDDEDMQFGSDDDDEDDESEGEEEEEDESTEKFVPDKFGLNDGFFSIDDFNRRTEALEQLDARGEPEAPSDEEDIDWDIDPATLSLGIKEPVRKDAKDSESEDEEDEEDGPTFGNMDLDAPEGASEDGIGEDPTEDEAEDIDDEDKEENLMYEEFFDPPPNVSTNLPKNKKKTKTKKSSSAINGIDLDDFENDIQRTIRKLRTDEFDEDSDSGLPINASTHEKQKAALLAQIRELEAQNVAKKSWTLMGEARAQDRPLDAALAEDLEFERTGKPLPIVTKETSEAIEELIKRRILVGEYDEVRKRRPEDVYGALNKSTRKDTKSSESLDTPHRRGLAEVYEEEHLRKTDPAFVDQKTEKRSKEYAEIEALWNDISSKLDSLASWKYKPKPQELSVTVRTDAPAISLEDARPSGAGGEIGTLNQLAPQEVFAPGDVKETGKIVTKGGTVLDRAELSRDQRKRMRQREKERAKKRVSHHKDKGSDRSKDTQSTVVSDLKKGGVKVIGKKGELQDVDGKEVKDNSRKGGSSLRL